MAVPVTTTLATAQPPEPAPPAPAAEAAPRRVLFVAADAGDGAEQAVRHAALDLARRAAGPVLLLDLATPANRQFDHFADAVRLVPRRHPMAAVPRGQAGLHFQRVEGTLLQVSRVEPDPSRFAAVTWQGAASALSGLLALFDAVVVAVPDLATGEQGLALAPACDGVVLVIRQGRTPVGQTLALRDRVHRAGGKPVGVVMTGPREEGGLLRRLPW